MVKLDLGNTVMPRPAMIVHEQDALRARAEPTDTALVPYPRSNADATVTPLPAAERSRTESADLSRHRTGAVLGRGGNVTRFRVASGTGRKLR